MRTFSMTTEHNDQAGNKLSRYRGQVGESISTFSPHALGRMKMRAVDEGSQQQDTEFGKSISRSMSRYRRRAQSIAVTDNAIQSTNSDPCEGRELPQVPAMPRTLKTMSMSQKEIASPDPGLSQRSGQRQNLRNKDWSRHHSRQSIPSQQSRSNATGDESQRRRMDDRDDSTRRFDGPMAIVDRDRGAEVMRPVAGTDQLIAEKKNDLERPEAQLPKSQRAAVQYQKPRTPIVDKFAFLAKRRKNKDGSSPGRSPASSTTGPFEPMANHEIAKPVPHIAPGGRGISLQKDAPSSAINGANRIVGVRCRHHTFDLEITPETTPVDILFQTSERMTYDLELSPSNCVVVEVYNALGLERRLRRYESIRDVINSWDSDTQNQLVVKISESDEEIHNLDISAVPKGDVAPAGFQLYMYHSNRPGKWNKRWVTLLENGQILCAKKANANAADKDTANLCRLSDYDIYTPTDSQLRRYLKPPKRHCFAVKSQQKTTVFMNTENYVQYFCTEDPKVAAEFKQKVHRWRSRCLVDRRPEARKQTQQQRKASVPKEEEKAPQITSGKLMPKKSVNVTALGDHRLRVSVDEAPYTIGHFEPLLDMKRFDKRLSQFGSDFLPPEKPDVSTMPTIKNDSSPRRASKATHNKQGEDQRLIDKIKSTSDAAFTGGGLLGDRYQERKAEADKSTTAGAVQERQFSKDSEAFTDGPSLMNKQAESEEPVKKPDSSSWFPSALEHSAKTRTAVPPSSARPNTSAGVALSRRLSISSSRPPIPSVNPHGSGSGSSRPQTRGHASSDTRSHHPASRHQQPHPNPLGSAPPGAVAAGMSHSNRRDLPKPLVNITPTIQEPPQWNRDNKGHGVRLPEGMRHLVDMISVGQAPGGTGRSNGGGGGTGGSSFLEVPPRSSHRRPLYPPPPPSQQQQHQQQASTNMSATSSSRSRSKSSGAVFASSPNGRSSETIVPPMPALPPFSTRADVDGDGRVREGWDKDRDRDRERQKRSRDREHECKEREAGYNTVPGRTGTLRVV